MIYTPDCFVKLQEKSSVIQRYFVENLSTMQFQYHFGWKVHMVPLEIILQEPALSRLNQNIKIDSGAIIEMNANSCYTWHQDAERGVCINMLLTPEHTSYCLFGNSNKESDDQYDIAKLSYEADTFYLFNNQAMHTVINFDEPRYLFSVQFEKHKDELSYSQAKQFV